MAYTWDVARDLKLGRMVSAQGGLASSLGYTAQYDAVQRMTGAATGRGSTEGGSQGVPLGRWSYAYGQADELISITEATGGVWQYASGAEGRITSRSWPDGSEAFAYDGEGRRIEDAASRCTWDWRGRLVQVDIKDGAAGLVPALTPHAGERVVYAYDATGRLLSRTHLGQIPPGGTDSDRPFIAKRAFVWDGERLAAEAGLNFSDQPIWRQQYLPGQRGLDDAPLVRVEQDLQATPSTTTYAILRDDMGTPVAVVDEAQGPGLGGGLRLLTRYLSAPYGQRHSELGPELVAIAFDATITKVASTDQRPTANQTVAGALRIVTTSPLASASLASGLVLEQWDQAAGSWRTAPRSDFAIGTADDDPTDLRVMRLAGWAKATRYRITLLSSITDTFGRGLILPEGERQGVVLELAVPEDGTTPPSYARVFPLAYDKSASDTLAGAFPGGQTFGFQGAWTDPVTGLAYHRARWYDPRNATWLTEDPLQDLDSPNLYAFVSWQPHMYTDPMGRCLGLDPVPCWMYAQELSQAIYVDIPRDSAKLGANIVTLGVSGRMEEAFKRDEVRSLSDSLRVASEAITNTVTFGARDLLEEGYTGGELIKKLISENVGLADFQGGIQQLRQGEYGEAAVLFASGTSKGALTATAILGGTRGALRKFKTWRYGKTLYHYTTEQGGHAIAKEGLIRPSPPETYLSVNEDGIFDAGIFGAGKADRSLTPNVFLTDVPPASIYENLDVLPENKRPPKYVVTIGEKDVMRQGFKVYRNVRDIRVYNVPCGGREGVCVSHKAVRKLKPR